MKADLESKEVLRSADGVTSPVALSASGQSDDITLVSLRMSSDVISALNDVAEAEEESLGKVIGKAFLLYLEAVKGHREGKAVGLATSSDMLETEFVGL